MSLYALDTCRHGRFLTNTNDTFVGHSLRTYGEWSEAEIALFSQIVRTGDVVLEAGANIGSHTVWLSHAVGETGQVLAFEPARHTHQLLCANLALNECLNVDARRAAVGAASGAVDFPLVDPRVVNNFGAVSLLDSHGAYESVPLQAIDDLQLARLDFLKSDIEGYEPQLLEGAKNTIAKTRPVLFLEITPQVDSTTGNRDALVGTLAAMGYQCYYYLAPMFNPNNFRGCADNVFQALSVDLLCVPGERVAVTGLTQALVGDTHIALSSSSVTYATLPALGARVKFVSSV